MALPVSNPTVDDEEETIHASDAAGYTQLPADHLSDSSDSTSDDFTHDGCSETVLVYAPNDGSSVSRTGGSCSHQNGGSVDHLDGAGNRALTVDSSSTHMDNYAASHNSAAFHDNGSHFDVQAETQNSSLLYSNDGHDLPFSQVQDGHIDNCGTPGGGHVININGMEIHVYGQLAGLQLSPPPHHRGASHNDVDDSEDVDESERQQQEDTAILRAKEAEESRRSAPLPPERCQAIKEAMQSISLGGYRPEWADNIPEEQWLNRLKRK